MEGWETLIYKLKLAIDSGLHCNGWSHRELEEAIENAVDEFGAANGMDAVDWKRW